MKTHVIAVFTILLCVISLAASDKTEITGKFFLQVHCHETFHEEVCYVALEGKDKFSPILHAINLPESLRKDLTPGMKIKVIGSKQAAITKTMSKGEIRKAMYKVITKSGGMPIYCKDKDAIINKIVVDPGPGNTGALHDHGKPQLKPLNDDAEEIEVTIPAHVVVESIEILKP